MSALPIVVGALAGIFAGLFLGDYAAIFRPVGKAYVMLLEVAVFPYLISSLLHGLSSMTPATALRLFRTGWPYYLSLWAVTFIMLWLLSLAIPHRLPCVLQDTPGSLPSQVSHLLNLLIPMNFFESLNRNYIPGVVIFCVFFGVAFQRVKDKQAMLAILDGVRQASLTFWTFIVRMVPVAVFALMADLAGTIRIGELGSIGIFLFQYFAGVAILAFWIISGCIQALTPLKFSEVIGKLRSALGIALLTTLAASAIPFVIEATRELAEKCGIDEPDRDDVARTNLSVAYPLGQLGNFFVYLFLIFAAFVFGISIPTFDAWLMPELTLLSSFGTPTASVASVAFVGKILSMPEGVTQLYVTLSTIIRYGQVAASVMGFAFLSFMVVLAYYGKVRIQWGKLVAVLGIGAVMALAISFFGGAIYRVMQERSANPYMAFSVDPAVTAGIRVSFAPEAASDALRPGESVIARIHRTGELRVGYTPGVIPFCYRNASGALAGYDVAMAYRLARQTNVGLRFIPFSWENLGAKLNGGVFDIVMSGIYLDPERLMNVGVSNPYFQSPLGFFTLRGRGNEFSTREKVVSRAGLRLGIFEDCELRPMMETAFPHAQIITVPNYDVVPDFSKMDAAFWSLVQAEAMAAAHPELVAVAPVGIGGPVTFVYLSPPKSDEFVKLVNYWLLLTKDSAFEKAQNDYWIKRLPRPDTSPRWSILRNVLGFGSARG